MTKNFLTILASALAVSILMFLAAIYGMNTGSESKGKQIINQCTTGGQFVVKRSVYKCNKVSKDKKHGVDNEAN